jgi:para-aminobenzoate synthetase component 1
MEIIHALEPVPRGVYTGAIGYFADGGDACFSVAIRTLSALGDQAQLHVGSGIVADSLPEQELAESGWKAAAMVQALTGPQSTPPAHHQGGPIEPAH